MILKKHYLLWLCLCAGMTLQAQDWVEHAGLPNNIGKHHPVTWGIDGYGYAATGTNTANSPTKDFLRYDPVSDSWEQLPAFPGQGRSFAIGTVYEGEGYLGFGATNFNYLGDIWKYNPGTEQWQMLTTCPCEPRRHPAFVIRDDRIFVGLGDGPSGNLNDWWEYDMNTDSWTQHPDLPGPVRHHPFQFVAGDHVYAGMGHGNGAIYNDWYRFDINDNRWIKMKNFPGEARVAGTQFDHAGYGYVLSGDGDNHSFMPTGEFWKYDAEDDSWEQMTPHPGISRWAPGSFVLDNRVYFLGGQDREEGLLKFDMWSLPLEGPSNGQEFHEITDFRVFPNPAKELVRIESAEDISRVTIISPEGRIMRDWKNPTGSLMTDGLTPGLYLIKATSATGAQSTRTIVIQ